MPSNSSPSIQARAEALSDLVRDEAASSERLGRLTDKLVDALLQAGLFSILLPEAAGGLGGTRRDMFDAAETLARADGSTGWCISLCNSVNFVAWRGLGEQGRTEVFGLHRGAGGISHFRKLDLWLRQFVRPMGACHLVVEGRGWTQCLSRIRAPPRGC
jgi:alkylation response protein AidB-like acyl-CoA dehydrogenase